MCFFRKKIAEKVKQDRERIESNSKSVESLLILAKDNSELFADLKNLQEKLKYLIPSDKVKVVEFDEDIKNNIEKLRAALTVSNGTSSEHINNILTELNLTIADRNTKL